VNAVFPPISANVLHQEVCLKFYGQVSICQAIAHNCKCGDGGKQLIGPIGYRPGVRYKLHNLGALFKQQMSNMSLILVSKKIHQFAESKSNIFVSDYLINK